VDRPKLRPYRLVWLGGLILSLSACQPATTQRPPASDRQDNTAAPSNPSLSCLGDPSKADDPRTVAVVPQLPPAELYSRWQPMLVELGRRSNQCFQLVVPESIPTFEQALQLGRVDYAFMNPYHQVMVKTKYHPLIRDGEHQLRGVLVVNRKSSVRRLADLSGQSLAFPAPNAFAASLLIRAELRRQGITISPRYVRSHSNVYRSVALQEADAGGGVNNTLARERPEISRHLKVLMETEGHPAHPFSALKTRPAEETSAVIAAWLAIANDPDQRQVLNRVQLPRPITSRYERDYAPLERLHLETLVQ